MTMTPSDLGVYAFVREGVLQVQVAENPGCPGFEEGEHYIGCFTFPKHQPHCLHWGWLVVPRSVYGSVIDRIRKAIRNKDCPIDPQVFDDLRASGEI